MDLDQDFIVQPLNSNQFAVQNLQVQMLRLDLLHPVISGNKYLKLLPWLQIAAAQGKAHIVTKGGPWSNHVHAAAFACHEQGMLFTAIIKAKEGTITPMLEDVLHWNGRVVYCNHTQYQSASNWNFWAENNKAIYIPMGGEGPMGIKGVTQFFNRLNLPAFDCIICPVGSGTTYAGIAASDIRFKALIGIDPGITDPGYAELVNRLHQEHPSKQFKIVHNVSLKKFGKWPLELVQKMNDWYKQWQIPTDIVYTGKMLYQLEVLAEHGFFDTNSKILLIHTGGLQGNRSLPHGMLDF